MTAEQLFEELEGSLVMVDGKGCYPQLIEEEGEEDVLEMLDGDICLTKSDIAEIIVRDFYIAVRTKTETHVFEIYELKRFNQS